MSPDRRLKKQRSAHSSGRRACTLPSRCRLTTQKQEQRLDELAEEVLCQSFSLISRIALHGNDYKLSLIEGGRSLPVCTPMKLTDRRLAKKRLDGLTRELLRTFQLNRLHECNCRTNHVFSTDHQTNRYITLSSQQA